MFDFFRRSTDDEDTAPSSALSVLGEDTTAQGTFDLKKDDLRVDGILNGDVTTEGHVHVSRGGSIHGEIRAGSIRIAGDAAGILHAQADLVVLQTASVHGILCADALTIEDEADFEGGLCDTADQIPALKDAFFSAEAYTIPALSSSPDEPPADSSGQQPSEAAERSVTLDIEPSSPPEPTDTGEETASFRSLQEGDGLPESPSSSPAAPTTEPSDAEPETPDAENTDDTEDTLSTIEW
ncbi:MULTISPECIES: bactofilin family protein [Salinibacter]|uniref:bactofilin family protein n=1 Tax=Salinibacter TaxID=146918 RepID=UPI0021E8226F|nr:MULTISPECIES: polymer-forming cytoskeletal protein [Salinibacter]